MLPDSRDGELVLIPVPLELVAPVPAAPDGPVPTPLVDVPVPDVPLLMEPDAPVPDVPPVIDPDAPAPVVGDAEGLPETPAACIAC